ncbi:hypothetical protein Bbelb_393400 [Branchiostoma belcheri]|nr:hypothetical protein Bbelb_393400 [Branchiostoma belcheri]
MAAPLVLWKEGSSKGTVGYQSSSPRKQQAEEWCSDSSDHRLEARRNYKDVSMLCYAVLRCVVGTRGLRCRVPVTQKAVRRRVRSHAPATQKAVRRPARARVPVTQKAIRRLEAACRYQRRLESLPVGAGDSWKVVCIGIAGITALLRNTPAWQARGAAAAGYITPNGLEEEYRQETRLDAGVSRQYEIGVRNLSQRKGDESDRTAE